MTSSSGIHIAKAPPKDPLNNETFWFYSFPLSGTLWPLRVGTPSTQGVLLKDQPRSHPGWVIEWWGPSGLWSSLSLNSGADCLPGPVIKEKAEIQFHSRNGKLWKTFFHFGGYHSYNHRHFYDPSNWSLWLFSAAVSHFRDQHVIFKEKDDKDNLNVTLYYKTLSYCWWW